jgi:hypothetical protein
VTIVAYSVLQSAVSASAGTNITTLSKAFTTANLSTSTTVLSAVALSSTGASLPSGITMTCGGTSMVLIKTITNGVAGTAVILQLYALNTPAAQVGTKPTVQCSWTNNAQTSMLIVEVAGIATGASLATLADGTPATSTGTGGASAAPGSYTSTVIGEFLLAVYGDDGSTGSVTIPSGYTAVTGNTSANAAADIDIAYKNSTGGTEAGTYTLGATAGQWATIMTALQLAAPVRQYVSRQAVNRAAYY